MKDHSADIAAYQIRESKRARRIKIQLSLNDGLVVVAPKGARHEEIDILVRSHTHWISANLNKLSARKQFLHDKFGDGLPKHIHLPAINSEWQVSYQQQAGEKGWRYTAFDGLCVYGDHGQAKDSLGDWLKTVARENLVPQISQLSHETGLTYKRIQIRAQKSRWGSCSARGTISLNRNILFFSPDIVRYLLVHELCHTRYLNHSSKYWALVENYCPDYRLLDRSLKEAWRFLPLWAVE